MVLVLVSSSDDPSNEWIKVSFPLVGSIGVSEYSATVDNGDSAAFSLEFTALGGLPDSLLRGDRRGEGLDDGGFGIRISIGLVA